MRDDARACFEAAVAAVEPGALVTAWLARAGSDLVLRRPDGAVIARHAGPVVPLAVGKGALPMARAAFAVTRVAGYAIVPHGSEPRDPGPSTVLGAAHPVPDAAGVAATAGLLRRVADAPSGALILVLLSGGASALLVSPADGVTLADKQAVTRALLAAGADIHALNVVRKHLSTVKGGGLARVAGRTAGLWTLALSDVVGDDPATIGSGPTVPDPSTFADAEAVLARYLQPEDVPPAVRDRLAAGRAGRIPETLKPGDPVLARTRTEIIAGNRTAVAAAAAAARARGYRCCVIEEPLRGDAAAAGRALVRQLGEEGERGPVALIAGGETTVEVVAGGRGGRSQQLALAAALALAGRAGTLLAAGTDGVDGPTDAAGAVVDGETVARAGRAGVDAAAALAATDSHRVLDAAGALLRTGPTGTNVADLVVALRGPR